MSNKTAEVRTRVEPKLKKEAGKLFKELGLNESEGVRLLLKGLVLHKGIPFDFKIPMRDAKVSDEELTESEKAALKKSRAEVERGEFTELEDFAKEQNAR